MHQQHKKPASLLARWLGCFIQHESLAPKLQAPGSASTQAPMGWPVNSKLAIEQFDITLLSHLSADDYMDREDLSLQLHKMQAGPSSAMTVPERAAGRCSLSDALILQPKSGQVAWVEDAVPLQPVSTGLQVQVHPNAPQECHDIFQSLNSGGPGMYDALDSPGATSRSGSFTFELEGALCSEPLQQVAVRQVAVRFQSYSGGPDCQPQTYMYRAPCTAQCCDK